MLFKEINSLFPLECLVCKDKAQKIIPLCRACQKELPWNNSKTTVFYYEYPIDHWITALKFHNKLHYANVLGYLFVEKMKRCNALPELLIPIPLHTRRLCKRGFNQALEIARPISQTLHIPLDFKSLQRHHATKAQSELTGAERHINMLNAFRCVKSIHAKHVAIFDDVITTGSTINAAYQALKKAGVKKIDIWACAKVKYSRIGDYPASHCDR